MAARVPPKTMAKKLVRVLRPQHPDYHYLKKVFQHTRDLLAAGPAPRPKRLPDLLTEIELVALYEMWICRRVTCGLTKARGTKIALASFRPTSAGNSRNMSSDSAPREPCTCLNRGGLKPTRRGVSARLSNGMRSQRGSRSTCTPISSGISCLPI